MSPIIAEERVRKMVQRAKERRRKRLEALTRLERLERVVGLDVRLRLVLRNCDRNDVLGWTVSVGVRGGG